MNLKAVRRYAKPRLHALATVTGIQQLGYFVPYRYAATADRRVSSYPAVATILEAKAPAIGAWIAGIGQYLDDLRATTVGPESHRWRSKTFPPRDAAAAYAMVRSRRPARILEIGSGTSTWFLSRAVADGGFDCTIKCIDPMPRQPIGELGVEHVARTLTAEDDALAAELEPGDIFFIDSSHVMLPGMDVDIEFNRMFPVLKPGVVVHVHDIFLPYDYPARWSKRMYSEQNALVGWLCSGYFDVIYPGHFASQRHDSEWRRLAQAIGLLANPAAGSMWLERS